MSDTNQSETMPGGARKTAPGKTPKKTVAPASREILTRDLCEGLSDEHDALARDILDRVSGKWPLWVVHVLLEANAPLRFSRILERVEGISQKVLTQTLRNLERDGLITREVFPEVPPRVEYTLSPLGFELLQQVFPFWQWLASSIGRFETARKTFDARG